MKAAVLSPGPSIELFDREKSDAALIVGVNRAAIRDRVDVWACGDYPLQQKIHKEVIGSPILLTASSSASWIATHNAPWRGEIVEFESLGFDRESSKWDTFTATAAVVYAASRGATEIDCYGVDWSGDQDFDGVVCTGNRSDARWTLEAGLFKTLAARLQDAGIRVRRITGAP